MSNLSNFDQVYRKMHQYLQHQISFIKSTKKYLILQLFGSVEVNTVSINQVKAGEV